MRNVTLLTWAALGALGFSGCDCAGDSDATETQTGTQTETETEPDVDLSRLERLRFNQLALRANIPVFWAGDEDDDSALDPDEVRALAFYPSEGAWVEDGHFTDAFYETYESLVALNGAETPTDERLAAVFQELSSAAPTLIETDLSRLDEPHRAFALQMLEVGGQIDALYARQVGATALEGDVAEDDPAAQSLFRRNWGPRCVGTQSSQIEACSAIDGAPPQPVDVYPADLQSGDDWCESFERGASEELLDPFTVVRRGDDGLTAVAYTDVYGDEMRAIAAGLRRAREAMTDPDEEPLRDYLEAAASAFEDNDWFAADAAWAQMSATNSAWYIRVGPDEVYWDPCSHKAGFHMTLSRVDSASLDWQERLSPLRADMERALAALSDDYEAREVGFDLPDFIHIVGNFGDDRNPFGATIGQSLPNWGPVSEAGGRTVAMTNLYGDPDSLARRRVLAEAMLDADTMQTYTSDREPGLLSTILHEATHNLGPSHDYEVAGRDDGEVFGGGLASMLEELKAQSGALHFAAMLAARGTITEERQREVYLDSIVWAFGHISRGMYTPTGRRRAYSQLAAIQVGFLMEQGAIRWDPEASAANGEDTGAFAIDFDAMPDATRALMTRVMSIKASGDRAGAEQLAAQYVDGEVVPQSIIVERYARSPRASFVYSIHP